MVENKKIIMQGKEKEMRRLTGQGWDGGVKENVYMYKIYMRSSNEQRKDSILNSISFITTLVIHFKSQYLKGRIGMSI